MVSALYIDMEPCVNLRAGGSLGALTGVVYSGLGAAGVLKQQRKVWEEGTAGKLSRSSHAVLVEY